MKLKQFYGRFLLCDVSIRASKREDHFWYRKTCFGYCNIFYTNGQYFNLLLIENYFYAINSNKNMDYLRKRVSGHDQQKFGI